MKNSVNAKKNVYSTKSLQKMLLYLTIYAFFIITIVTIATPRLSNNEAHNAIFGSFDSTGAAIILIGVPYLCLEYLKYYH